MIAETEARQKLRQWVLDNSRQKPLAQVADDTRLIELRIITSVQVLDLLLYIERLTGRSIETTRLKPGAFKDIDTIYANFFRD